MIMIIWKKIVTARTRRRMGAYRKAVTKHNDYNRYLSLFYRTLVVAGMLVMLSHCQSSSLSSREQASLLSEKKNQAAMMQMQLGLAYLARDQKPRAKEKLLKALALAPQSSEVNAAMAYFWEITGEPDLAKKRYEKALTLDPHHGAASNNYATFLCKQKDYRRAEQYFRQAVADTQYINSAVAYENAGICMEKAGHYHKAMYYYEKSLQQDSTRKHALKALLTLQLRFNQPKRALLWIQRYNLQIVNDPELLMIARKATLPS